MSLTSCLVAFIACGVATVAVGSIWMLDAGVFTSWVVYRDWETGI